ncbi:MAG TPA: UDP-N-acetylglucosamine 1-carboxyvinyltransferase [bacterium]|nr:UDP-N-acetylglucosamine 1-carboxyvinyltransferase [bacterium]
MEGGRPLRGRLRVAGAKNSSLAVIAAAALAADRSTIENVPRCRDVFTLLDILRALGMRAEFTRSGRLEVDARQIDTHVAPYDLCRQMRASYYMAGVLLARLGRAEVPLPGGDDFGTRPVDFHVHGFEALGAHVVTEHGYLKAEAREIAPATFYVPRSSVGTTINIMLAASRTRGTTTLQNAAREPEVVDTAVFLSLLGARVRGAGTSTVTVEGTPDLRGATHAIIPDRIEAGTYLIAGVATHGDILVEGLISEHGTALLTKLADAGATVDSNPLGVRVRVERDLRPIEIDTAPYPGFATDYHPQCAAMLAAVPGQSAIRETVFENRFQYASELRRMGAELRVDGDTVIIHGVRHLSGASVEAVDIRAGAAVVIAGLTAQGTTEIANIEHLDRGYEGMEEKLRSLGGEIQRVKI